MTDWIRVTNERSGLTVAERARRARGLWQTVFGLHLHPPLQPGEGLLLPGATTIDTLFMGYPIDLLFLDRSRRVTRVVPNLRPWRLVIGGNGGHDCLELPAGAAESSDTSPGDLVRIEPVGRL